MELDQQLEQLTSEQMYEMAVMVIMEFFQRPGVERKIIQLKKAPKTVIKKWLDEHYDLKARAEEVSQMVSELLTTPVQ